MTSRLTAQDEFQQAILGLDPKMRAQMDRNMRMIFEGTEE